MAWTDAQKLQAIRARIDGVWDDPALMKLGCLFPDSTSDILRILDGFEGPGDETWADEEVG